jgi:hypothetical protein
MRLRATAECFAPSGQDFLASTAKITPLFRILCVGVSCRGWARSRASRSADRRTEVEFDLQTLREPPG